MEERKRQEIAYYDKQAEKQLSEMSVRESEGDFEGFDSFALASYRFCYELLKKHCRNKKILDYGCGNGVHTVFLAKVGKEVVGIDLSKPSLELAKKRVAGAGVAEKTSFLCMDCEKLEFPDNSFDLVFDGGTLYALDLDKAFREVARVLKPDGVFIGIETFGHNPLTNLNRKINYMRRKRTAWALGHIFQMKDVEKAKQHFGKIEIHFFHFISWFVFPLLSLPGGKFLLHSLEKLEEMLLRAPFFQRYAFKVVLVFASPKKQNDKEGI